MGVEQFIAQADHGHTVQVPFSIGPLAVRIALLLAVLTITAVAMLRGFYSDPSRQTVLVLVWTTAGAAFVQLMLSDRLGLPSQVVVLLLLLAVVPLYLMHGRGDHRVTIASRFSPWIVCLCAVAAIGEFTMAWLGLGGRMSSLHTGVFLGLVGLSWIMVCRSRRVVVRITAIVMAAMTFAATAHAMVLRAPEPVPGAPLAGSVEFGTVRMDVLVVPHRPGWNLVWVGGDSVSVGTQQDTLLPATPQPGTTGTWAPVMLPAGRSELWLSHNGMSSTVPVATGDTTPVIGEFGGRDGPECFSTALGAALTDAEPPAQCPADDLSDDDAKILRAVVQGIARQGNRDVTVKIDDSARSIAAAQVVQEAAATAGLTVSAEDRTLGPLLVLTGWAAATDTLREIANGSLTPSATFVAPWLLGPALFDIPISRLYIGLAFTPGSESAQRYLTALNRRFPNTPASAGGYAAWADVNNIPRQQQTEIFEVITPRTTEPATTWAVNVRLAPGAIPP